MKSIGKRDVLNVGEGTHLNVIYVSAHKSMKWH